MRAELRHAETAPSIRYLRPCAFMRVDARCMAHGLAEQRPHHASLEDNCKVEERLVMGCALFGIGCPGMVAKGAACEVLASAQGVPSSHPPCGQRADDPAVSRHRWRHACMWALRIAAITPRRACLLPGPCPAPRACWRGTPRGSRPPMANR